MTQPSPLPLLQVEKLAGRYGRKEALRDVSFSLDAGSVLGLLGPNGSGKSTLLRLLALAARPQAGTIYLEGRDAWQQVADSRRLVGYVPQYIALFEELTVRDNLLCWTRLDSKAAHTRASQLVDDLDLGVVQNQRVTTLSGGMKRLVNLAVALMNEPRLLLLDEPYAGVDSAHSDAIDRILTHLAKKGVGIVCSGHQPEQILGLADRLLVLSQGRPVFSGSRTDFLGSEHLPTAKEALDRLVRGS